MNGFTVFILCQAIGWFGMGYYLGKGSIETPSEKSVISPAHASFDGVKL